MLDEDKNLWKTSDPSSGEEKAAIEEIFPESQSQENSSATEGDENIIRTTTFSFIKLGKLDNEQTKTEENEDRPLVIDNANLQEEKVGDFKGEVGVKQQIKANMKKESLMSTFSEPASNGEITIKNINGNGPPSSNTK